MIVRKHWMPTAVLCITAAGCEMRGGRWDLAAAWHREVKKGDGVSATSISSNAPANAAAAEPTPEDPKGAPTAASSPDAVERRVANHTAAVNSRESRARRIETAKRPADHDDEMSSRSRTAGSVRTASQDPTGIDDGPPAASRLPDDGPGSAPTASDPQADERPAFVSPRTNRRAAKPSVHARPGTAQAGAANPEVSRPADSDEPAEVTSAAASDNGQPGGEPAPPHEPQTRHPRRTSAAESEAKQAPKPALPHDHTPKPGTGAPPALRIVRVEPANARQSEADTAPRGKPSTPSIRANKPVDTVGDAEGSLTARIKELESAVARNPNDVEQQFRLRLLYLAANQDDKALADTPGMNADLQASVRGLIRSLMEARSGASRDPALWANRQLEALEELRGMLRAQADLAVPVVSLCTRVEAFGIFDPIDPPEFPSGSAAEAIVYVEVDNFRSDRTPGGEYRTMMSMRTTLLTKDGKEKWSAVDENIEDLSRRPRKDFFLVKKLTLPPALDPGVYVLKVEVEDKLGSKANSRTIELRVGPGTPARGARAGGRR